MSRRKQAKPKSTRIDDEDQPYDSDEISADQVINQAEHHDELPEQQQPNMETGGSGGEDDDEEGSIGGSERSTSATPPTPGNGLTRHECSYCESSFGSFFLLKQHEQDNHAHLMPFKCRYCSKGFKHKRSHDRHEKSHSGIRKHKCAYCGQAFFRSDHLKLHLKTHETSKYAYVCVLCQRGFHSSSALESHMQAHEKQKRSSSTGSENLSSTTPHLRSSRRSKSPEIDGDNSHNADSDYPVSPKPTIAPPSFQQQQQQHAFQCSVCSNSFKTADQLLRHMDSDHRILKQRPEMTPSPFKFTPPPPPPPPLFPFPGASSSTAAPSTSSLSCPFCPSSDFYSEEALELHLQALHGANLSVSKWTSPPAPSSVGFFGCGVCGLNFTDIGALQKHTLASHTMKDLDSEPNNNASSNHSETPMMVVKNRSRITAVNPDPTYECQTCGRTFDSILALHGHASSVHGSLPEHVAAPGASSTSSSAATPDAQSSNCINAGQQQHQLYQCGQCDETVFTDLTAFSIHMRQHLTNNRDHSPVVNKPIEQQQQFACDLCGAQYVSEILRDSHAIKHYLQKESQYGCKSCTTKTFTQPDELQKHLLDMHAIHLYRCSLCKEIFESRVDIQVHFAVGHSDETQRFRCRSCNAAFTSEEQFNAHVQAVHLPPRRRSSSATKLGGMDKEKTGGELLFDLVNAASGGNGLAGTFCCPFCQESFSVEFLYEKHLENNHRAQMEMFMMNEFIPKASVSQLLMQAVKFTKGTPSFDFANESGGGDGSSTRDGGPAGTASRGGGRNSAWISSTSPNWSAAGSSTSTALNDTLFGFHSPTGVTNGTNGGTTLIKCNICDRRCETMLELAEHKLQHCKVIHSQTCNFCHEPIGSMAEFHAHTRQHNAGNGIPMACIVCKQSLVSALDLQTHAKFHLMLTPVSMSTAISSSSKCNKCDAPIPTDSKIQQCASCSIKEEERDEIMDDLPLAHHQPPPSSQLGVKCRHCNLKFETSRERNEHESEAHESRGGGGAAASRPSVAAASGANQQSKPYQCIKCQKSFATEAEIQAHVTTHVLQDGIHHYCMLCKKVFDSPSKLQCHLIEHSFAGCSEMQCYLCNAIFSLPQPLQQHMLTKHGVDDRPYECLFPQCEQKFFFRAELENHAFVHQPPPPMSKGGGAAAASAATTTAPPASEEPSSPINCPTCSVVFYTPTHFNLHLSHCNGVKSTKPMSKNSHEGGSEKKRGSSRTISPTRDERHSRSRSSGAGSSSKDDGNGTLHYCPHCSKTFHSLSALQGHSHVHMISKSHQCTKCRKVFPTAAKLRNHQRQHSGDKPFPCTLCMRFFSRKDNLKVHMRIHYKQNATADNQPSSSPSSPLTMTPPGSACGGGGGGQHSNGSAADFPTMVPRSASGYLASLSTGEKRMPTTNNNEDDQQQCQSGIIGNDHSSSDDGSTFDLLTSGGTMYDGRQEEEEEAMESAEDEEDCNPNED